jgi:RNA polymerase sigma-70 factor (ECF subfamily)
MIETLLDNHRAFLRYLERRVGDRELAEDILQDAFAKVVDHPEQAPSGEAVVPWFYRTLRNAAIDQYRRRAVADRALAALAREPHASTIPGPDVNSKTCACVSRLATTLKPEYAEALQAIEIEDVPIGAFARTRGLSPSHAGVRVFRARQALKKRVAASCGACATRGCRDCSCGSARP